MTKYKFCEKTFRIYLEIIHLVPNGLYPSQTNTLMDECIAYIKERYEDNKKLMSFEEARRESQIQLFYFMFGNINIKYDGN